jgi:transposase
MVKGATRADNRDRFAGFVTPPWTRESEEWQRLDRRLPADHLARRIDRVVESLDLGPLWDSYLGVGKKALRPDLLLKAVLYEMQNKRPSPAQWTKDVREYEPLRWLLMGIEPSRGRLYRFRDRVAPFLAKWNAEVLGQALEENVTSAEAAALDSTFVAANASRRGLLNEERLQKRQATIDQHLQHLQQLAEGREPLETGEPSAAIVVKPAWLADSEAGLRQQKERYEQAAVVMKERHQANEQRPAAKRKPADKIVVSATEPEAIVTRDKEGVFRPVYAVQLLRDLHSPLIFAFDVLTQNNDNSVLEPMVEHMVDNTGIKPNSLLVDSGYVSIRHLEFSQLAGITLYGPAQENDFSEVNNKKAQSNQHTELPKSAFKWLPEEQTYQCPEGHRLEFAKEQTQRRVDHTIRLSLYVCPPEHCQACPRQSACTKTPEKGRSVSRMQNEDLLDALRERMQTAAAKTLYKQRSQTVELNYADLKEHRGMRRFHSRGRRRVTAEIGLLVLAHNLLAVDDHRQGNCGDRAEQPGKFETTQTPSLA